MDNRAMDSKNYFQVLSSLFSQNRQGQGRPQRQQVVSSPLSSDFSEGPVDSVRWSKGLFRAINEDLAASWAF